MQQSSIVADPVATSSEYIQAETAMVPQPDPPAVVETPVDQSPFAKQEQQQLGAADNKPPVMLASKVPPKQQGYMKILLRFASTQDKWLMVLALFCAAAAGCSMPLMSIVFGTLSDSLGAFQAGHLSADELSAVINAKVLYFVYIAIGIMITTYVYVAVFTYTAENSAHTLRIAYLEGVLRQDIAYFDKEGGGSVSTRLITDTQLVQDGIGEKVPLLVMNIATFIAGFAVAFSYNWQLTLALSSALPAIIISMSFFRKFIVQYTRAGLDKYALAGNVAEEALGAIRTVTAFMAQEKMAQRYSALLLGAEVEGIKKQILFGCIFGFFQMILYGIYSLSFYFGGTLLLQGNITPGTIVTCFLSVVVGSFAVAGSSGEIQAMGFAVGAGSKLLDTVERVPTIDPYSQEGVKIEKLQGKIEVENVTFRYPARPDNIAVKNMNLVIEQGDTVALVGSSGSGKSTLVQLVERFYDPEQGRILIDGVELKTLNVNWLRQQIGYVTQEPILFKMTIWENVAHGLIGTPLESADKEIKLAAVIEACKQANAHDFVSRLPEAYETQIGERGLLLSGGQKQRIAIARAIIKNPKVLLLDEATSALDTHSEKVVQDALDHAAEGRTTIVIAHRLSTIRHADKIIVMDRGVIIERGNHKSLMQVEGGFYQKLVDAQKISGTVVLDESKKVDPDQIQQVVQQPEQAKAIEVSKNGVEMTVIPMESGGGSPEYTDNKAIGESAYAVFSRVFILNLPEINYLIIGFLGCAASGCLIPVFAYIFGNVLQVFYETDATLRADANFWSLMFLVIAFVGLIANMMKFSMFGISSEKLTTRLRDLSFRATMRQEIGWFDEEKNSVGSLTSSLASSAQQVQNISGGTVGSVLELIVAIIGTTIISLVIGWKLGLVTLACLPPVIFANKLRMDVMRNGNMATKVFYESSAQVASEAVSSIRTIAALTRERHVLSMYERDLVEPLRIGHHHAYYGSMMYAISQSFSFLTNAVAFYYGAHLFIYDGYTVKQMFTVLMASILAGQSSGRMFSMIPDISKAKIYAHDILSLLNRKPRINSANSGTIQLNRKDVKGRIEFKDVHFQYPTRPGITVLNDLNLTVEPGQNVALVGASGCGKSTTVGLTERFYDVTSGRVTIDGNDVSQLDLRSARQIVSIVSQEPSLFDMSIRENILLGVSDADNVTQEQVVLAAKDANIHDFIMSLTDGYETSTGGKGSQLSGGQKQRIAIARAIIMQPKVLLLDEATSALDAQSERVVQAALDQAAKGRTTIAIAHRLSTIKDADCIYVFQNGVVLEKGTHAELVKMQGLYALLATQQDLNS